MPLYSFHCAKCEDDFETLARHDETPACPVCKGKKVSRLMSRIARPRTGGAMATADAGAESSYSSSSDDSSACAMPSTGGHGGGCDCC